MSVPAALGTLIGLVFVFALVSLFCSAITEAVANRLEKRARYLLTGLRSMLDREQSPPAAPAGGAPPPSPDKLHDDVKAKGKTEAAAEKVAVIVEAAQPDAGTGVGADRAVEDRDRVGADSEPQATTGEDPRPGDLTRALFDHPLIRSLQTRKVRLRTGVGRLRNPQYIPSKIFAQALIDTLLPATVQPAPPEPGTKSERSMPTEREQADRDMLAALQRAVQALDDDFPAKRSLLALLGQSRDSLIRFQESVEGWYDAQMGRISGWYKRWSKVVLAIVGFAVAVLANLDTVQIAHGLYVDEPVRTAVVAQATAGTRCQTETDPAEQRACVDSQVAALDVQGLPIWYPAGCTLRDWDQVDNCWNWSPDQDPNALRFLLKLLGWGLTAFAVSFGAPFWFDALSKLGSLRNAGPKPTT